MNVSREDNNLRDINRSEIQDNSIERALNNLDTVLAWYDKAINNGTIHPPVLIQVLTDSTRQDFGKWPYSFRQTIIDLWENERQRKAKSVAITTE